MDFLDASIPDLVERLSVLEKIALLAGPNWWNTNAIERLGIPAVRMSDGPNGVRGSSHFVSTPAQCLPCATALASSFDPSLIHDVGKFLAEETKIKSSVILLAPTCNIQRSPLGGRSFESFSEDPHLSGTMAAAYVNGLQSNGVASTIKHLVANDQEHERTAVDSVMSDRALREIYLYPFMLAQKHAKPWAYMTSYGRIGGVHCSENSWLLNDVLRKEWGFDGIVISDWHGTYSTDHALKAGLDLEMPGPPRWRTPSLINHTLSSQKLKLADLDTRTSTLLAFVQKLARRNPDVVFGDGIERSRDSTAQRQFARKLAGECVVMLKNEGGVLPLVPVTGTGKGKGVKTIAVIGPNAKMAVISGGGSAALKPTYAITPYDGIVENAPAGVEIKYAVGCYAHRYLPTIESLLTSPSGKPGWLCSFYNLDPSTTSTTSTSTQLQIPTPPLAEFLLNDTRVKLNDFIPAGLGERWTLRLRGTLVVERTMEFELGLTVAGRAKLWIDGKLTIDNWTTQRPGDFFYGQGTAEETAVINLTANKPVDVLVEYTNSSPPATTEEEISRQNSQPALMRGLRLGGAEKIDPDQALADAVTLASQCDAVIVVAGLTSEWESEGFDRPSLGLPGRQDELIERVGRANGRTVVVVQAGSAISMPWIHSISGLLQSWYLGNETGSAIADVLFGTVNPSGCLPLTLPVRIEDTPAYLCFGSENGKVQYREDVFVGYKWYQARKIRPLFPFGFGLSYTTFALSDLKISTPTSSDPTFSCTVSLTVKNTGPVTGSQVIQLYVSSPRLGVTTPPLQLRGFAKAKDLKPGASTTVRIALDKYAVSFWDVGRGKWKAQKGRYGVHVGTSSDEGDLVLRGEVVVESTFFWSGL